MIEDVEAITLKPGDILLANASYTITQADIDNGSVKNEATVSGTPPNSDKPVEAKDEVTVSEEFHGNLELKKSTSTESYAEIGQTITYDFVITNNSKVTMNNIVLIDPMLGGNIELENTTLKPGKSITV